MNMLENNENLDKIHRIIKEKIRPMLAMHGGDIDLVSFEDGIVKVRLKGACRGCAMAGMTLKNGVEEVLKFYIPEIIEVENVPPEDDEMA